MLKGRNSSPKTHSFTEEQIRAKAREIWQKRNRFLGSPDDDWNRAIEELEAERSLIKKIQHQTRLGTQEIWNWTGFKDKKFWDLLQLLVVPIVLAAVGFGLQEFAKNREHIQQEAVKERERIQQESAKQREREMADDRAKQEILTKYLEEMATLLHQELLNSKTGSEIFAIAQSKTVTALQSLDPKRQQTVIQFLEAANLNSLDGAKGLLHKARMSKVDLRKSDLSGCTFKNANISLARLSGIDLSGCTLKGSALNGSDLTSAKLGGIDLSGTQLVSTGLVDSDLRIANLIGADLDGADLTRANLSGATLARAKNLTNEQLAGAKLCQTTLPDYSSLNPNRDCEELGIIP